MSNLQHSPLIRTISRYLRCQLPGTKFNKYKSISLSTTFIDMIRIFGPHHFIFYIKYDKETDILRLHGITKPITKIAISDPNCIADLVEMLKTLHAQFDGDPEKWI